MRHPKPKTTLRGKIIFVLAACAGWAIFNTATLAAAPNCPPNHQAWDNNVNQPLECKL